MSVVEESIEVHADAQRVYEMWTDFEHYPAFMPGIIEVRRTGETLTHWVADFGGRRHEWDTQVVQMDPEDRIAFQTVDTDPPVRSTVSFQPTADGTRITFCIENDPGLGSGEPSPVHEALERFRAIVEEGPPHRWPA